jgi:hypothetical protein
MYAKLSIPPEIISKVEKHVPFSNHNGKKVGASINANNSNKNNGNTGITQVRLMFKLIGLVKLRL